MKNQIANYPYQLHSVYSASLTGLSVTYTLLNVLYKLESIEQTNRYMIKRAKLLSKGAGGLERKTAMKYEIGGTAVQ
jgi:hypothetical protein